MRTKYMTSQNIYPCNMNCYCVKCKKQTESRNPQHILTKNGKHMMSGLCNICGRKKSQFISEKSLKEGGFLTLIPRMFGMGNSKNTST